MCLDKKLFAENFISIKSEPPTEQQALQLAMLNQIGK